MGSQSNASLSGNLFLTGLQREEINTNCFFECNFHEIVLIVLIQLSRTSANDMERVSYCTFELFKVFKVLYEREVGRRGSNRANFKRKHLHS